MICTWPAGVLILCVKLAVELREGHPYLSRRVIAAVPLLISHPSGNRLLELARTVFRQGDLASRRPSDQYM